MCCFRVWSCLSGFVFVLFGGGVFFCVWFVVCCCCGFVGVFWFVFPVVILFLVLRILICKNLEINYAASWSLQ